MVLILRGKIINQMQGMKIINFVKHTSLKTNDVNTMM